MKRQNELNERGFTIIEVVLVLAIAGLIFLIVFLALPQLQQSRRDSQRRSDAGRILAAVESWAANHNGSYPAKATVNDAWLTTNVGGSMVDPSGNPSSTTTENYTVAASGVASSAITTGQVYYGIGEVCSTTADGTTAGTSTTRDVAVAVGLENGIFCQDNQ